LLVQYSCQFGGFFARAGLNPAWSFLLFLLPIAPPLILAYAFWPALDGQKLLPRTFD
jgi:hypothetical protein